MAKDPKPTSAKDVLKSIERGVFAMLRKKSLLSQSVVYSYNGRIVERPAMEVEAELLARKALSIPSEELGR